MNLHYTIFFLYAKNIEHQTLVSFLLLTSIVKGKDINLLTYKLLGKG
jgi:hypothetical protein